MSRYARRVDASQPGIVRALRAVGASVTSLAPLGKDAPDLLVGYAGDTFLAECKSPGYEKAHKARLATQHQWRESWRGGPVFVWTTPEEAVRDVTMDARARR